MLYLGWTNYPQFSRWHIAEYDLPQHTYNIYMLASSPGSPFRLLLFSLVYVDKDRGAWGRGYLVSTCIAREWPTWKALPGPSNHAIYKLLHQQPKLYCCSCLCRQESWKESTSIVCWSPCLPFWPCLSSSNEGEWNARWTPPTSADNRSTSWGWQRTLYGLTKHLPEGIIIISQSSRFQLNCSVWHSVYTAW